MAYREVTRVEIEEVVRRWQAGEGVIIQGHKASDIHSHPATLSTVKMDLYQVLVGRSTTPFASSRARCGESLSR